MLSLTRNIIDKHNNTHAEFEYYKTVIEKIEENVFSNPDISIESSKTLIEGISKTILRRLDITFTQKKVDSMDFPPLFKEACWCLGKTIPIEHEFINQSSNMINTLANLRNKRGDISHGKTSPKPESSTKESARMIMHIADSIVHYMLDHFYRIDLSHQDEMLYEDHPEFNEFLDEYNPIDGLSYSRALFDQDEVSYEEQLRDFIDEKDLEDE